MRGYSNRHVPQQMVHRQLHATLLQRVRDDLKHCVCLGNRVDNCHMASWTIPRLVSLTVGRRMRMVELYYCTAVGEVEEPLEREWENIAIRCFITASTYHC